MPFTCSKTALLVKRAVAVVNCTRVWAAAGGGCVRFVVRGGGLFPLCRRNCPPAPLKMMPLFPLLVVTAASMAAALSPAEWRNRTVYQLLTDRFSTGNPSQVACTNLQDYCGGTWSGIADQLRYIQGMGFDAIWISPIPKNFPTSYHGYHLVDLWSLNEYFGAKEDLQRLVSTAHSMGIAVMLDVVANHVGPVGMNFSQVQPFNTASHYHADCIISDWSNQPQVEYCRLPDYRGGLPDLDQNSTFVRSQLLQWIAAVVSEFGFDGIRVDTVPEVHKDFWASFQASAGVYAVGEVFNGDANYIAGYAQQALDAVLSYPLFFTMRSVYGQQQSMNQLESLFQAYASAFRGLDLSLMGTFIDNHDNPRFLYGQKDVVLYKNALVLTMMTQGIPIVYYGSEQGYDGGPDPGCRESLWPNYNPGSDLYRFIAQLNAIRRQHVHPTSPQVQRYSDNNFYAFTRGSSVFVATTNVGGGSGPVQRLITYHPFADGTTLCDVLGPSYCIKVANSQFAIEMDAGFPRILVPTSGLPTSFLPM